MPPRCFLGVLLPGSKMACASGRGSYWGARSIIQERPVERVAELAQDAYILRAPQAQIKRNFRLRTFPYSEDRMARLPSPEDRDRNHARDVNPEYNAHPEHRLSRRSEELDRAHQQG